MFKGFIQKKYRAGKLKPISIYCTWLYDLMEWSQYRYDLGDCFSRKKKLSLLSLDYVQASRLLNLAKYAIIFTLMQVIINAVIQLLNNCIYSK